MKRVILILCAAAICIVSCTKTDISEKEISANLVEITVSLENETKSTYDYSDGILKCYWEKGDQVSIVSVDKDWNQIISVDTFTAQNEGKSATFTGTYTYDGTNANIFVFYPALTALAPTCNAYLPAFDYCSDYTFESSLNNGITYHNNSNSDYFGRYTQFTNGSTEHLNHMDVMTGLVTRNGSAMSATIGKETTMFKFEITVPTTSSCADWQFNHLYFVAPESRQWVTRLARWTAPDFNLVSDSSSYSASICLGEKLEDSSIFTGITVGKDRLLEVYLPVILTPGFSGFEAGDKLEIRLEAFNGYGTMTASTTLTEAKKLEKGKIYTIKATLQ